MQVFHEVLVILGYIMLFLLAIIAFSFFAGLMVISIIREEPEDTDGDVDPELIKDDENQIFLNP